MKKLWLSALLCLCLQAQAPSRDDLFRTKPGKDGDRIAFPLNQVNFFAEDLRIIVFSNGMQWPLNQADWTRLVAFASERGVIILEPNTDTAEEGRKGRQKENPNETENVAAAPACSITFTLAGGDSPDLRQLPQDREEVRMPQGNFLRKAEGRRPEVPHLLPQGRLPLHLALHEPPVRADHPAGSVE